MCIDTKQRDGAFIAGTYQRADICLKSGEGTIATSFSGESYLDFGAGIGVNSLGFCNPDWIAAVQSQLQTLAHTSNLYYTEPATLLAETLCQRTGMEKVFFANSGAEANECAIKTARKYSADRYTEQRHEIITLKNSFHGRTITTLAATGQDAMHKHFGPFPEGFVYVTPNDIQHLTESVNQRTCAILIECIQGEGGVNPLDNCFVSEIQRICAKEDILLIVDEVQSGIGRTGKFLCSEYYDLKADIVTLAKGLGGGLPIGAVLFGKKTKDTLQVSDHGSTFGGNPVVCAGALAVLNSVNESFLTEVTKKGLHLMERLSAIKNITSVSGKGLMCGASLLAPLQVGDVLDLCRKKGLLLLRAKQRLRFLPPLTITIEELDRGLDILESALLQ